MTQQNNRRLVEALAKRRDPATLAEDIVLHDQGQERSFYGRTAAIAFLDALFVHGFTATRAEAQMIITDEQQVALAFLFHGRQEGTFMGIPPTRQEVVVPMVLICRIEAGRISQVYLYYNAGTLLRQLGLG